MTKSQRLSRRSLAIALLLVLVSCRTYEYVPDIPSEQFDASRSLGSIEVRYERAQRHSPKLHSSFRRNVIEPDMGIAGTYVFAMVYPTIKVGENYSSLTLEGEALGDGNWRFHIPYKPGWNGPQDLRLYFAGDWGRNSKTFLFRFLKGQSCLNDYSLDTPGEPTLHISIRFKEPACLLPCTPSLNDPARCSNFWR